MNRIRELVSHTIRETDPGPPSPMRLPLAGPEPQIVRPAPLVEIGSDARDVADRIHALGAGSPPSLLDELADVPTIARALDALRHVRQGENGDVLVLREPVEVIVVGNAAMLSAALPGLRDRVREAAGGAAMRLATLELDDGTGASTDDAAQPPWSGLADGRFRLARRYDHGCLTPTEHRELAAQLMNAGAAAALSRFAARHKEPTPVLLGAAVGWLPDLTLGEALARRLLVDVARQIAARPESAQGTARKLPPWPTGDLRGNLGPSLEQGVDGLLARFDTNPGEPVAGLGPDLDDERLQAGRLRTLARWVRSTLAATRRALADRLQEPGGFRRVEHLIETALEGLEATGVRLESEAGALASRRDVLAREVRDRDARRLATPRMRPVLRFVRTRLVRRSLRRFGQERAEVITTRLTAQALRSLAEGLAAIQGRFADVAQAAAGLAGEPGDDRLHTDHPNFVPLQDTEALDLLLHDQLDRLAARDRHPLLTRVWDRVAEPLLGGTHNAGPEVDSWSGLGGVVAALAGGVPGADRPLAEVCDALLPRFLPRELAGRLTRRARPRPEDGRVPPRAGCVVTVADAALTRDDRGTRPLRPFAVAFAWDPQPSVLRGRPGT